MYVVNGIAYAGTKQNDMQVINVAVLDDMMMILTFSSGEKRLYDASELLKFPAFQPLANHEVFSNPVIDHGVVTWNNGEIDIAPETMYANSYQYEDKEYAMV